MNDAAKQPVLISILKPAKYSLAASGITPSKSGKKYFIPYVRTSPKKT